MDTELGRLIAARICHDIVSPLGAISNGVELLGMTRKFGNNSTEMSLIEESVARANARIRYFRVAFGPVGADECIGAVETQSLLAELQSNSRLLLKWEITGPVPRKSVKLAFLMLLCIETGMPWGGTVEFEANHKGWAIRASSDRQRIEANLWDALAEGRIPDAVSPSQVQFPLLIREARNIGCDLTVRVEEGTITSVARLSEDETRTQGSA